MRSVDRENTGREKFSSEIGMVAEVDVVECTEDSIYWTVIARSRGAAGVPRPGHVFTRIPQENLGNTSTSLVNVRRWITSSASQGKPETEREGRGGGVRTRSTDDNGEPDAEMHWDPEEGRGEQDDASIKGNMTIHGYRGNHVN